MKIVLFLIIILIFKSLCRIDYNNEYIKEYTFIEFLLRKNNVTMEISIKITKKIGLNIYLLYNSLFQMHIGMTNNIIIKLQSK